MRLWRGGNADLAADARIVRQAESFVLQICRTAKGRQSDTGTVAFSNATNQSRLLHQIQFENTVLYEETEVSHLKR